MSLCHIELLLLSIKTIILLKILLIKWALAQFGRGLQPPAPVIYAAYAGDIRKSYLFIYCIKGMPFYPHLITKNKLINMQNSQKDLWLCSQALQFPNSHSNPILRAEYGTSIRYNYRG